LISINANQGLDFLTYSFIATKTQKDSQRKDKNTNYNLVKICVLVSLWQRIFLTLDSHY